MKTFREISEVTNNQSHAAYTSNVKKTIEELNKLIDYGRKIEMDNKQLNFSL